tara:strand:+ start:157 stop:360 length:204 start_codon:yes stop_codon:yes gene_type:complete
MMKKNERNKLNKTQLEQKAIELNESLVNLRFQKALQQLEHPQKIKLLKKEIAQVKTMIKEFEIGVRT